MAVAGIHHSDFDNRPRNASHCAAPRMAPATAPPMSPLVRLVTGPVAAMAMRQPRNVGSQRSQRPFAVEGSRNDLAPEDREDMSFSVSCTCERSPPQGFVSRRVEVVPARWQGDEGRELHQVVSDATQRTLWVPGAQAAWFERRLPQRTWRDYAP